MKLDTQNTRALHIWRPFEVNMEARGDEYCLCCEQITKYKCITCSAPVCNRCTVIEDDEEVDGWCAGMCVGYCNECELSGKSKSGLFNHILALEYMSYSIKNEGECSP